MKGQVSIEFISLLVVALLASSILVTELNERVTQYSESTPYSEAQSLAQKVAYSFDYVKARGNSSVQLGFEPGLEKDYGISAGEGQVIVSFDSGSASFPTRYEGSQFSLNSTENYVIKYNGSYHVES